MDPPAPSPTPFFPGTIRSWRNLATAVPACRLSRLMRCCRVGDKGASTANPPTTARRECCSYSAALLLRSAAQLLSLSTVDVVFLGATAQEPPEHGTAHLRFPKFRPPTPRPRVAFGVGHSTTFSNCCSGASQTIKMHDEVSDSAIIASTPIKNNAF